MREVAVCQLALRVLQGRAPLPWRLVAPIMAALGVAITAGCVTMDDVPKDFATSPLAGRLDGRDWQYVYAYTDPISRTPEEDDIVFVFLPYRPKAPCPSGLDLGKDSRHVRVSGPKAVKLVSLKAGSARNLAFQYQMKNGDPFLSLATKGKLQVISVGADAVKGRVFGVKNANYWVSGTFTAALCNRMDFR